MQALTLLTTVPVEGIGYIGRIMSHSNPKTLGPYIMQTLLLLVAPALFVSLSEHSSKPQSDIDFFLQGRGYIRRIRENNTDASCGTLLSHTH